MEKNTQKIEPKDAHPDGSVEVHSIWDTVQGEGPFFGTPAVFIRLAGCNLQCHWCDTDYTSVRKRMTPLDVVEELSALPSRKLIVITGGEPFRQNLQSLVLRLIDEMGPGGIVQIETNGTLGVPFILAKMSVVCSPKTRSIPHQTAMRADAFKYVVKAGLIDSSDGLPLVSVGPQYGRPYRPPMLNQVADKIFVQPLDEKDEIKNKKNLDAAVESCRRFGYRLSVQTHKLAGLD